MGIYQKLAIIQKHLIAPKGQTNSFGKYNYRSCEDILKALKPLCDENGVCVFMTNDLECIGDRNYVKATVTITDLESGESLSSTAHAREEEVKKGMDGSQITGASSSYARKYALSGLFCIDNEKDSDATNDGRSNEKKEVKEEVKQIPTIFTPQEIDDLVNLAKQVNVNPEEIARKHGLTDIRQLTRAQYVGYMEWMAKLIPSGK